MLAPISTFLFSVFAWAVVPLHDISVFADVNVAIFFILSASSLGYMVLWWLVGLVIQNMPS